MAGLGQEDRSTTRPNELDNRPALEPEVTPGEVRNEVRVMRDQVKQYGLRRRERPKDQDTEKPATEVLRKPLLRLQWPFM